MPTLAQFSKNIRRRGRQIENAGSRVVRRSARKALRSLVISTPVDKGVARSNWRVGVGGPATAQIKAYAPGRHLGINERSNASAAIAAGNAKIDTVRGLAGVGLKTAVYISNNTKYIGRLNAGYSKQAGSGFVQRALAEARATI